MTLPDPTLIEHLLHTAEEAARRAGQVVRADYGGPRNVREKDGPRDLVTDTDKAAQDAALALIRERHPGHALLAEEDPHAQPDSDGVWSIPAGVVWAVDPLDGTTNYTTGLPVVCVSIGAALDGVPVAGAIYDPLRDEMFSGGRGLGATLKGRALAPLPAISMIETMVSVDWSHVAERRDRVVKMVGALARRCRTIRALGSAALALAYVACGRVQLYLNLGLQPWDTCAAAALLPEVGGALARPDGSAWQFGEPALMAAHPAVLAAAAETLAGI